MKETETTGKTGSPSPKAASRPLWYKLALGLTAGVVVFLVGWYAYLQLQAWSSLRHWNEYKARLEAGGEKLDVQALAPPPLPDDKNFANHPLIAKWFASETTALTNGTQRWFFAPGAEDPDRRRAASGPGRGDTRGSLLERWAAYYSGHKAFPQAPAGSSPAQVVRTALSIYDADIAALREAMKQRPSCRYPLNYEMGGAVNYPHLVGCRSLCATLELRVMSFLHLGQVEDALAELQLGYFISDTLKSDPLLMSLLVRMAVDQMMCDAVVEGIQLRSWNDAHLASIAQYLAQRQYMTEFASVLRGERNVAVHQTELLRQGQVHAAAGDTDLTTAGRRTMKLLPQGLYYRNLVGLVNWYQEEVLPTVNVSSRRLDKQRLQSLKETLPVFEDNAYGVDAQQSLTAIYNGALKAAHWQTLGDALMTACALERFRLAQGGLPQKLEELTPKFLPAVPVDCLTGKPLSWRKESEDSYRVYGWGWNGKDDNGRTGRQLEDGDWGLAIKLLQKN